MYNGDNMSVYFSEERWDFYLGIGEEIVNSHHPHLPPKTILEGIQSMCKSAVDSGYDNIHKFPNVCSALGIPPANNLETLTEKESPPLSLAAMFVP